MSIPSQSTRCSNCNLDKSPMRYYDTQIEPKEGVYESKIERNYCENCENFTRWFMGKGVRDMGHWEYSSNKSKIERNEDMLREVDQELINIEGLTTNLFYRVIYSFKKNSLRRKKEKLEMDLDRLNTLMDWSLNSDSIKFYNKLNPKPKCLECGYDKLYENPKHTCGGDIYIETDKSFRYQPSFVKKRRFEYDEYGNVTKCSPQLRGDRFDFV